jgi:YHS domain-containing protein
MGVTNRDLEQAYAQHKEQYGGRKEDYFALLYLTREFEKSPDQVARQRRTERPALRAAGKAVREFV